MDHLFAAVPSGNHYFTIQWCKTTGGFTIHDSLAHHTKPEHKEAMVLLWAILLASARADVLGSNLGGVGPERGLCEELARSG